MSNQRCRPAGVPAIGEGWHFAAVQQRAGTLRTRRGGHILENRRHTRYWREPRRSGRQPLGFSGSVCGSRGAAVKVPTSETKDTV